jgi:putative ABC transport system ATP-binding protein
VADGASVIIGGSGIEKTYRAGSVDLKVLRGVDVEVLSGESVAILGPSGSGKSTLLHILGGLDRPDRGRVHIDGTDLSTLDGDDIATLRLAKIGFVFQFFNLLPNLSLRANVELPLMLADRPDDEVHSKAGEMLDFVGLGNRGDHHPSELSGGEQQRAAIARALVSGPRVVMADEPTGNLDSQTSLMILELMQRMQRELEQTTVIVTHDRDIAASADRVLRLEDGLLKSEGDAP